MSVETKAPVKSELNAKQQKILSDLETVGSEIANLKSAQSKLMKRRNDLFVMGRKQKLSFQKLADAAGIRRETAHYAILRATENGGDET